MAPLCDPVQGCISVPAPDGTRCGDADCVTASVCLQGACVQKPVPDGAECGSPSPCQPLGVCHNQICERPAAVPLSEDWTWRGPDGGWVDFHPTMDDDGTLYFRYANFDSGTLTVRLGAVRRDGVPLYLRPCPFDRDPQFYEGMLFGISGSRVIAIDASTGTAIWDQDVGELISDTSDAGTSEFVPTSLMISRAGDLLLSAASPNLNGNRPWSWTLSLDARTALLNRLVEHPSATWFGGFSDGSGTAFYSFATGDGPRAYSIAAEDSSGSTLWTIPAHSLVRGVPWKTSLITAAYVGSDCRTSLEGWEPEQGTSRFLRPDIEVTGDRFGYNANLRAAGDAFFAIALVHQGDACYPDGELKLIRFDPEDGSTLWSMPLGAPSRIYGELVPTNADSLLFADQLPSSNETVLRNVGFDGKVLWECELPSEMGALVGLHQGRAFFEKVSGLAAIDLPGLDLVSHGWVNEYGDPEHRRRPH